MTRGLAALTGASGRLDAAVRALTSMGVALTADLTKSLATDDDDVLVITFAPRRST